MCFFCYFSPVDALNPLGQKHVAVQFENSEIESFPGKTFPSYLQSITLTRCKIRTLSHRFISGLRMGKVSFEYSTVEDIQSEAFYSNTMVESLNIEHCLVDNISTNGIASALNKMVWINSTVNVLETDALTCTVANVTLNNCLVSKVNRNGFTVKEWNKVILFNNTFTHVAKRGIDLSHYSDSYGEVSAELDSNYWGKVERDFIVTGSGTAPFISVTQNTYLTECECGNTFMQLLTTNGSQNWFLQELRNNSRCPVSDKVLDCLLINRRINNTASNLLDYEEVSINLLCEPDVYMCVNEVSDVGVSTTDGTVPGRPHLPNRLRVLAYFIMVMGIFIIVSLLITMCVFLCRRKIPRKKSPPGSPLQNMETVQPKKAGMPKSLSGGEYADIVFKHNNGTSVSRPRSMLLEDVEMEDKGVQTMPSEFSSEVLDGLREKLSKPDSFWDAKETIDHLYDLIQVKERNSGLSSPPDVTMCNGQTSTTASTARLLPSTSSSPVAQITSAGVSVSIGGSDSQILQTSNPPSNASSPVSDTPPPLPATSPPSGVPLLQRYAQIRNKVKTAPLCEYADPSDSSMHIYSELTPQPTPEGLKHVNSNLSISKTSHSTSTDPSPTHKSPDLPKVSSKLNLLSANRLPSMNGPILCEYTEPKDVQTHVYAELSSNSSSHPPKSQPSSKSSSPVKSQSMKSVGPSPYKQSHVNTITIAVPPPPIAIPHSNSFHNSPRHLNKIRENDLSTSNPAITSALTPVKVIHVNDDETPGSKTHHHRRRWPSEKLKRSQSSVDATGTRTTTSASSLQKLRSATGSDTQKRPLPSIPLWQNKNEAKSQF